MSDVGQAFPAGKSRDMLLIRFTSYALDRMAERGITEDEVRQVLAQPEQV
jgi:hypothetical protein